MPNICQLSAIACSPWTSTKLATYCQANQTWYFTSVKDGLDTIIMHRKIFYLSLAALSISPMASNNLTFAVVALSSLALMSHTMRIIYNQAKIIQGVLEPHLKVSCCGVEPLLNPTPESAVAPHRGHYGTANHQKNMPTAEEALPVENP